jgi:hypothetical protein
MSMFNATSWPLAELLRALKVSRRLTGSRDEPGILNDDMLPVVDTAYHGQRWMQRK